MQKIVMKIEGMMCAHCEARVNDAVRGGFPVKKVTSSHTKGETVILTDRPVDPEQLKRTVEQTGYRVLSVTTQNAPQTGGLRRLFRK